MGAAIIRVDESLKAAFSSGVICALVPKRASCGWVKV